MYLQKINLAYFYPMSDIVNKVKESGLISLDLAKYKTSIEVLEIDIAGLLWQQLVLKEKDFRLWVKENDWQQYNNKAVYIHCSVDAIIPTWAFMLIASKLQDSTSNFIVGTKIDLEKDLILKAIHQEDITYFEGERVIIKGCSDISCPEFAMVELVKFIQPVAKSIMYGEPCSSVPVFKRK